MTDQPLQVLYGRAGDDGTVPEQFGQRRHRSPPPAARRLLAACPRTKYGGLLQAHQPGRGRLPRARARWRPRWATGTARTAGSLPYWPPRVMLIKLVPTSSSTRSINAGSTPSSATEESAAATVGSAESWPPARPRRHRAGRRAVPGSAPALQDENPSPATGP